MEMNLLIIFYLFLLFVSLVCFSCLFLLKISFEECLYWHCSDDWFVGCR